MRSWMSSRMSCPSVSFTFFFSVTSALSYSAMFSACTVLRRSRLRSSRSTGSTASSRAGGFIPMNTSSASVMAWMRRRVRNPRTSACTRVAASSGDTEPPMSAIFSSSACVFLSARMRRARSRPCRPRSFTCSTRMASSSPRLGGTCSSSSHAMPTLYFSTSASKNLARPSSSVLRSSTKYLGMGSSSTSGVSFRSTRMSSKLTLSIALLSRTSQLLISSMRPSTASTAFFMSIRFCGCAIWSYASSSLRKICTYLMYMQLYSLISMGASAASSGCSASSWSSSSIMLSRHWMSNVT
mmetsp:Transcript_27563/g.67784  ORF Transcript_27563/g.67784 Transcript_27563/m.67784 type:complete len:297 (+) Transcript_27563:2999-3889(+)